MAKRQQVSSAESELFLEWEETLLKGVGKMPQIINTNLFSLNAQRNLNETQNALGTSLQRLSSGLRINSAKDDAAGLAIAERFSWIPCKKSKKKPTGIADLIRYLAGKPPESGLVSRTEKEEETKLRLSENPTKQKGRSNSIVPVRFMMAFRFSEKF